MKKILLFAVMVCMVLAVPAFAAPVTGGNPAYLVPGVTDAWSNAIFVDTGDTISGKGTITSWQIYAGATGQVELLIYSGTIAGPSLTLVGSDLETVNHVGLNTFSTSIAVTPGDYIGWYTPGAGVIAYNDGGPITIDAWDTTGTPQTNISDNVAGSSQPWTGNREYAITVVPEPSILALLIPSLGFVGVIRKKFMA